MSKSFTIHDLPKEERPRERLVKFGEQALSAQELLQVILGRGIAGESVMTIPKKIKQNISGRVIISPISMMN